MIETTIADSESDADLLDLFCRRRDEEAFAELVRRHGPMVLGICHQTLRHHQDAQDAFQATFLVLATRATAIKKEHSLASWLYKVAYRTSMRAAKRRQRATFEAMPEDIPTVDDPLTAIHLQSLQLAFYEELSQIPASYQGPVILCYLEGKSRRQAAEELNCSDASVKAKLSRGRQLLRSRLSRRGIALPIAMTSCSAAIAAIAQTASPAFFAATVSGCLGSLHSAPLAFPTSVTNLVTQGNAMTSIPTTAKYVTAACLSGIAFLGIAWATTISTAKESSYDRVIQLSQGDSRSADGEDAVLIRPIESASTRLVSDTNDFAFYMGIQRGDDPKTKKLKDKLSYAEKKSAAYLMLRDAERERAELAEDVPSKMEAEARAKLHEAEVDRLTGKIQILKSKLQPQVIDRVVGFAAGPRHLTSPKPVPCCRENNLAYGRTVTASSQEEVINNLAQLAVDGDLSTRWCADDAISGEWIQVDLGALKDVTQIRIHWEMMETAYAYKIETSEDGETWDQSVDMSENSEAEHMSEHDLNVKSTRFIRITFLGNSEGFWGSIREIEVTDSELAAPPVEAWEKVRDDATGFEILDLDFLLDA